MTGDLGPYINDDGDIWVPRTVPYLEARRLAKLGIEYGDRLAYVGRTNAQLVGFVRDCDCDERCVGGEYDEEADWREPAEECIVPAWHFRSVE